MLLSIKSLTEYGFPCGADDGFFDAVDDAVDDAIDDVGGVIVVAVGDVVLGFGVNVILHWGLVGDCDEGI